MAELSQEEASKKMANSREVPVVESSNADIDKLLEKNGKKIAFAFEMFEVNNERALDNESTSTSGNTSSGSGGNIVSFIDGKVTTLSKMMTSFVAVPAHELLNSIEEEKKKIVERDAKNKTKGDGGRE